jgi:hypothetical protein
MSVCTSSLRVPGEESVGCIGSNVVASSQGFCFACGRVQYCAAVDMEWYQGVQRLYSFYAPNLVTAFSTHLPPSGYHLEPRHSFPRDFNAEFEIVVFTTLNAMPTDPYNIFLHVFPSPRNVAAFVV